MPSSTSSSDRSRGTGAWLRTWGLALGLAAVGLTGWEAYARRLGFEPTLANDVQSWPLARAAVRETSTVFLGTSRSQAGLDPRVWADEVGGTPPPHLAIPGGSALPSLEQLAAEDGFRGLVVMDFLPRIEFDATRFGEDAAAPYLEAYAEWRRSPARRVEARLRRAMPPLAARQQGFSPRRVVGGVVQAVATGRPLEEGLPTPRYFLLRPDRYLRLDFTRIDAAEREAFMVEQSAEQGRPASGAELDAILDRLRVAALTIEARGGRVVFVHFPHCGAVKDLEDERYPRARYWDRLEGLGVGEALHTADVPALAGFDCPDGSHLDMRDAGAFTRALARTIVAP